MDRDQPLDRVAMLAVLEGMYAKCEDLAPGELADLHRTFVRIGDRAPAREVVAAFRHYYGDFDRADRTPRDVLYLHIGLLCGLFLEAAGHGQP